jgi:hypothetical protein
MRADQSGGAIDDDLRRPLFIALIRAPPPQRDAAVISKGESMSLSALRILDARLSDRTFLAGNVFSMGDIPAAATVHRWYALDIHHPDLPNVLRWYDLMRERSPFRRIVYDTDELKRSRIYPSNSPRGRPMSTIARSCKAESGDPTLRVFAVVDQDDYVVTRLYRIQPKRRSCQHEVSRFQ